MAIPLKPVDFSKPRLTALIYGGSGSGKTHLYTTLIDHKDLVPALILMCDQGQLTLKEYVSDEYLTVVNIDSYADMVSMFEWIANSDTPYKTIGIDNLNELHRKMIVQRSSLRTGGKGLDKNFELQFDDYKDALHKVLAIASEFVYQLPQNIIVTALAKTYYKDDQPVVAPAFDGQASELVPGYYDLVGYLHVIKPTFKEKKAGIQPYRQLQLAPSSGVREARIRGGLLPDEVNDPSWATIYATISE